MLVITEHPLDPTEIMEWVRGPECGAVVTFLGTVRAHSHGRQVLHLEYEAYQEMALRQLQQVGEELRARWGVSRVALCHRVGRLEIGQISLVVAVASPHRAEAFAAASYAVDRIKEIVPIWKKEVWADGEAWVESA